MGEPLNPRNLPQKATPGRIPPTPLRDTAEAKSNTVRGSHAEVAATMIGAATGVAMLGMAIWGLWVSADVARHVDTSIVGPQQHKLSAAIFLLTWLVIFGPFLFFGIMILRSTFAREKRDWLVSLRVFTYIVSLRARAEMQRREFFKGSRAKQLPPAAPQKCIDLPCDCPSKDEAP